MLGAKGLNLTRTVNGNYLENPSNSIPWAGEQNTLAPRPGRYLAPWARSSTPGYANGGNKFDLDKWDEAYFRRLKDFVREAGRRGIVVEFNLNYVMYGDGSWRLNPMNALNNINGFDETHEGTVTKDRRREAWAFILSGGAIYNNLDWSFAIDDPTGTGKVEQPGGRYNGEELRRQLKVLKDFIHGFDFIRMHPHNEVVQVSPKGTTAYALLEPGVAYAIYLLDGAQATLSLDIEAGRYRAEWVNPRTGATDKTEMLNHTGGRITLASPPYVEDIALRLVRMGRTGY